MKSHENAIYGAWFLTASLVSALSGDTYIFINSISLFCMVFWYDLVS